MKILVVEDDKETSSYIANSLKERGHNCDCSFDGHDALFMAREEHYDVIIMDRMIPQLNGLELLKVLRASNIHTPVLFLTALGRIEDRVEGLENGADDYLIKPFSFSELYARICSLARRPPLDSQSDNFILKCKDLEMNLLKRTVTRNKVTIDLHPTEFKILEFLLKNQGRVVTRTMLLEGVWDFHFAPKTNIIETHISRLRSKVDKDFDKELIKTVRGAGYQIDE